MTTYIIQTKGGETLQIALDAPVESAKIEGGVLKFEGLDGLIAAFNMSDLAVVRVSTAKISPSTDRIQGA